MKPLRLSAALPCVGPRALPQQSSSVGELAWRRRPPALEPEEVLQPAQEHLRPDGGQEQAADAHQQGRGLA